jgi:hypothetical protein
MVPLTGKDQLWGGPMTDERYLITVNLPVDAPR